MTLKDKATFSFFAKIFLIAMIPIHLWGTLMIFNDLSFVAERTTYWDALGYSGYGFGFSLVESLIAAFFLWLISLGLPAKWTETRVYSILGISFYALAGASIVDMVAHLYPEPLLAQKYLIKSEIDPFFTFVVISGTILIVILASVLLTLKVEKIEKVVTNLFDRVMVLGFFYLVIDTLGIILVILRNLNKTL